MLTAEAVRDLGGDAVGTGVEDRDRPPLERPEHR
jgi:hypothetical protein